jgi:predicted nuclease with RNAse H fold
MERRFVGIDVQIKRGIPVAVMDCAGRVVETLWLPAEKAAAGIEEVIFRLGPENCFVGIDAPRQPMPQLRTWSCTRGEWMPCKGNRGRHCELVVNALGLANPQWTPLADEAPEWMQLGFDLFQSDEKTGAKIFEVFPTATYRALDAAKDSESINIPLTGMSPGPKDMLDAIAGAFTVWRYVEGKGSAVGGGDGLGEIILPTVITKEHPIHRWPEKLPGISGVTGRSLLPWA